MRAGVSVFAGLVVAVLLGLATSQLGRAADGDVLHALPAAPPGAFRVSRVCALCHAEGRRARAMRDAEGRDVSPFGLWQSSMMANASRDPIWRAAVAVEGAATPGRKAEIEAVCMRCHAPMARPGLGLAGLMLGHAEDELGEDGASCTVCHRIVSEGLGEEGSFSGAWRIDEGDRVFGPHAEPFARPMLMHTGFVATEAPHVLESRLCATCHTLLTSALHADGRKTGATLPEQAPYLEWRNSLYTTETDEPSPEATTCQGCHLPLTDSRGRALRTRIARNPGGRDFPPTEPREPYGQHLLVGGNALAPRLLRGRAELLGTTAPDAAFARTLEATEEQLRAAGELDLAGLEWRARELRFDVRVANRTGHRLPTAHPTRRVWLAVEAHDATGERFFHSGIWDAEGRIVGEDGEPLPAEQAGGPTYDHRDRISAPSEVALYEAQMVDPQGKPTWLLMRGERFVRDDRLLPRGWRAEGPHPEATRPRGVDGDTDFGAGGDIVHYRIGLPPDVTEPVSIRARLVHQAVGARWLAEWKTYDLTAVRFLTNLLHAEPPTPSTIATLEFTIGREAPK